MTTETQTKSDERIAAMEKRLKVLAHRTRRKALMVFRVKGPIAPIEVAHELNLPISDLSYHCRELLKHGYIELVKTEPVRGAVKSYYVATEPHDFGPDDWQAMDEVVKESVLLDGIEPMLADFAGAVRDETFPDDGRFLLARTPLKALDQQGVDELLEAHHDLMRLATRIESEAADRMAVSGEAPVSISSGQQCFPVTGFGV